MSVVCDVCDDLLSIHEADSDQSVVFEQFRAGFIYDWHVSGTSFQEKH